MKAKNIFSRGHLLYGIYVLILLVIGLEVFGRVYLTYILKKSSKPKFMFDYFRVYKHKPGFTEGDQNGNWIVINQQGFRRNTEVSKTKPKDTFRIFLMGGSAGHGISSAAPYPLVHIYMNQTIDFYLENMLKSKYPGKNFEVINAAVTGYQCFQHTAYLLSEIIDYQPDMVFFFDGINDHFIDHPDFDYYYDNKYLFWQSRLQNPSFSGLMDYFMLWLSNYSGFARGYYAYKLTLDGYTNEKLHHVNLYPENNTHPIATQSQYAKRGYLRAIETNIQLLKTNHITPVISFQPIEILRNENSLSASELKYLNRSQDNMKRVYPAVIQQLQQLTSRYQVAFLDFNPAFNEDKYKGKTLFIDYCHLSPLGAEVVARNVFPVVDSLYQMSNTNLPLRNDFK